MLPAAPGIWAGYEADELQRGKRIDVGAFIPSPWTMRPEGLYSPVRVENM